VGADGGKRWDGGWGGEPATAVGLGGGGLKSGELPLVWLSLQTPLPFSLKNLNEMIQFDRSRSESKILFISKKVKCFQNTEKNRTC
jgi:hypothetical protein